MWSSRAAQHRGLLFVGVLAIWTGGCTDSPASSVDGGGTTSDGGDGPCPTPLDEAEGDDRCTPPSTMDVYLETLVRPALSPYPSVSNPAELFVDQWSDRDLVLSADGQEMIRLRFPSGIAAQAAPEFPPGSVLRALVWFRGEGTPPRDAFRRDVSVRLEAEDGRLLLEGGDRPFGTGFSPNYWGTPKITSCESTVAEQVSDYTYYFPSDGDAVPVRTPVVREADGRTFMIYHGQSLSVSSADPDCADCGVSPQSLVAFSVDCEAPR